MPKQPAVYIMASRRNGTLYVGVTGDLVARAWQHRSGAGHGFTKEYGVTLLVYFETHAAITAAIAREKQLKGWRRAKKIALLERVNPGWRSETGAWSVPTGATGDPARWRTGPRRGLARDERSR